MNIRRVESTQNMIEKGGRTRLGRSSYLGIVQLYVDDVALR